VIGKDLVARIPSFGFESAASRAGHFIRVPSLSRALPVNIGYWHDSEEPECRRQVRFGTLS
jgi:hypothetical protein